MMHSTFENTRAYDKGHKNIGNYRGKNKGAINTISEPSSLLCLARTLIIIRVRRTIELEKLMWTLTAI